MHGIAYFHSFDLLKHSSLNYVSKFTCAFCAFHQFIETGDIASMNVQPSHGSDSRFTRLRGCLLGMTWMWTYRLFKPLFNNSFTWRLAAYHIVFLNVNTDVTTTNIRLLSRIRMMHSLTLAVDVVLNAVAAISLNLHARLYLLELYLKGRNKSKRVRETATEMIT